MIRTNLSIAAEILRREIKQMIPEAAGPLPTIPENQRQQTHVDVDVDEDTYGNKNYTGSLLEIKCTQLSKAMGVGEKVTSCLVAFGNRRGLTGIGLGISCDAFSGEYHY